MEKIKYSIGQTLLKVENVSLSMNDNQILKNINVEIKNITREGVKQGQVIGFLGPSGVGKSKFAEVISGIINQQTVKQMEAQGRNMVLEGNVLVGENLLPTHVGRIGVVQQQYPLLEHRSVYGNFEIVANNRFKDKAIAKEKITSMLETLGLQNHAKYYPANLSGGQRQRVAIGQALINCEDFIIFDEPFSGLDPNMITKVIKMIQQLTTQNELLTIIIISHDISATAAIADTLWLMGKDQDKDGNFIPGAHIVKQIDLMERGLAWIPDIALQPEFSALTREIRAIFPSLG